MISTSTTNQDRLSKLSNRINSLQSNLSLERNQKQEVLETKFNSTIERIFEYAEKNKKKFALIEGHMGKIMKVLKEQTETRERLTESKEKEFSDVYERLNRMIESEKVTRIENKRRIINEIKNENYNEVKEEINQENQRLEQNLDEIQ